MLSFFRSQSSIPQSKAPVHLPLDIPIEEECFPEYHPHHFYHANPGEILNGQFQLKVKLGYGRTSTVWLAEYTTWSWIRPRPYVVIKICDNRALDEPNQELSISNRIASAAAGHPHIHLLRLVQQSFEISGPQGKHLCLILEPLREPIWQLRRRFGAEKAESVMINNWKHYIGNILDGLSLLHTKCHVIHTDLKLDNILVTIEDQSIIEDFVELQSENPMARKVFKDHVVYRSHNLFGLLKQEKATELFPKLTDFGFAQRGDGKGPLIMPIQPRAYMAPEVLLGTGWSYSADIWNLGFMIWSLLAGQDLITRVVGDNGRYSARHHLAEMVALLGPIPQEMIERERVMRQIRWRPKIVNDEGILCDSIADFFGGPFFDEHGRFVGDDLVRKDVDIKTMVPDCITEDQVDLFVDFMLKMLCWVPEKRATAEELRAHPWLVKRKAS